MINRYLLRIKAVQVLYSFYVSKGDDAKRIEEELSTSISKASDLYYCVLQLIVDMRRYAERAAEHLCSLEEPESDPLYKLLTCKQFVENKLARQLEINDELKDYIESHDMEWVWQIHKDVLKKIGQRIQEAEYFETYATDKSSFEADVRLWKQVLQNELMGNEDFEQAIEDVNIYWNDDIYNAISFAVKTIKKFQLKEGANQPLMPIIKSASEMDYARRLVSYAITHFQEADELVKPFLKGWELERIPMMDLTIIRAAVAEMQAFSDIHVGVTMNEYIEIAKTYCAENSVQFVSGVLYQIGKKLQPLQMKEEESKKKK